MIVAVTGGGGFVGRHLVGAHLRAGDDVRVLTRDGSAIRRKLPGATAVIGDLTASGGIPAGFLDGARVLYHCAAELRDPAKMEAVNIGGAARLLEAAAGRIGRWVQLSSVGVYGPRRGGTVTEDTPLAPENDYERSKAEADRLVAAGAAAGGFEHAILRPSIVFGADMPNRSLRQLAEAIRRGVYFHLGSPGASANYIHVDNVIHALRLCATHPAAAGRVFNLSDHRPFEDFVAAMALALGVPAPRLRLPAAPIELLARLTGWLPGNPLTVERIAAMTCRARYPIDRIRAELGYAHVIDMEQALTATIAGFTAEAT